MDQQKLNRKWLPLPWPSGENLTLVTPNHQLWNGTVIASNGLVCLFRTAVPQDTFHAANSLATLGTCEHFLSSASFEVNPLACKRCPHLLELLASWSHSLELSFWGSLPQYESTSHDFSPPFSIGKTERKRTEPSQQEHTSQNTLALLRSWAVVYHANHSLVTFI